MTDILKFLLQHVEVITAELCLYKFTEDPSKRKKQHFSESLLLPK